MVPFSCGPFPACVTVPPSEYQRLETGRFERCDVVTPFITWCHDTLGLWGSDWMLDVSQPPPMGDGCERVFFAHLDDAVLFMLRWSGD